MIASWMLYALLVGSLVAAGAWILEEVFRLRGMAARFVWLGAMLGAAAIVAAAPLRGAPPVLLRVTDAAARPAAPAERAPGGLLEQAARSVRAARADLARGLNAAAAVGGRAGRELGLAWLALSSLVLALTGATLVRARRARRRWPVAEVSGERVRVAPAVGPAVLGVRRPEVVVPAWLLGASDGEQRLVVMHEQEHVRARDPLLLLAGCVSAALMPWNPAGWWMLRRLRAAVEVDCDARVLRRGVDPREYGAVLIDVAGRGPGLSLGAPALAGSPSILERRLRAMTARLPRYARLRAGLLGTLGLAVLAGACETPLPTSAEVEKMDVAAVEARAGQTVLASAGETTYFVDGKQVGAEEARAIAGDRIARMEVTRAMAPSDGRGTVHIYTHAPPGARREELERSLPQVHPGTRLMMRRPGDRDGNGGTDLVMTPGERFEGLLIIDGVVAESSALRALRPNDLAGIEIIKGDAAARAYDDPRAARGVIRVTTKRGAGTR